MDPNANLEEQIRLTARLVAQLDRGETPAAGDTDRLCELVQALHNWISRGGALPAAWSGR